MHRSLLVALVTRGCGGRAGQLSPLAPEGEALGAVTAAQAPERADTHSHPPECNRC